MTRITMRLFTASAQHPVEMLRKMAAESVGLPITNEKGERIGVIDDVWFDEVEQALTAAGYVDKGSV